VLPQAVWHEAVGTAGSAVPNTELCVGYNVSLLKYVSATDTICGIHVVSEIVIWYKARGLVRVDLWTGTVELLVRVLAEFSLVNVLI